MDILEQCHSRLIGWLDFCMAYYTHVAFVLRFVISSSSSHDTFYYISLCTSANMNKYISKTMICRAKENTNERRWWTGNYYRFHVAFEWKFKIRTRRIRVIKLHDIYVDSESRSMRRWRFFHTQLVAFVFWSKWPPSKGTRVIDRQNLVHIDWYANCNFDFKSLYSENSAILKPLKDCW